MAKAKVYVDVSGKSQVVIVNPSKKSQERARERVRTEFSAFDKANSRKRGTVIIRKAKVK